MASYCLITMLSSVGIEGGARLSLKAACHIIVAIMQFNAGMIEGSYCGLGFYPDHAGKCGAVMPKKKVIPANGETYEKKDDDNKVENVGDGDDKKLKMVKKMKVRHLSVQWWSKEVTYNMLCWHLLT